MKLSKKTLFTVSALFLLFSSHSLYAGGFGWITDFNIKAEADMTGFRTRLSARFEIGSTEINTVMKNVHKPADAYLIFRLGRISRKPLDFVLERYRTHRKKGWGALAKSLGIKPGSKEFHALKNGTEFYADKGKSKGKEQDKNKGKGHSIKPGKDIPREKSRARGKAKGRGK